MVFSSLQFLLRFMPAFFILYYIVPKNRIAWKNAVLLMGSLVFYAFGEPVYVFLMIGSIVVNYFLAWITECARNRALRRGLFILTIALNLSLLVLFKYAGLSLPLPIGISFYTFQIISYVTDVYNGRITRQKNILTLGVYITMFPQLIAGPIVEFSEVERRLSNRRVTPVMLDHGLKFFILGLSAKVILANHIGILWNEIYMIGYESISTPLAYTGALAYTFQLYFDFLGYSLMAIGLGKMLGFTLPVNFRNPYVAKSATEFWQRWHITLGRFFRKYVYIPLGGNRHGMLRTLLNLLVVWALTGLWHGSTLNFLLWGLFYFVFLAIERLFLKKWLDRGRVLPHIYMWILLLFSWVIFAITDFNDLWLYLKAMNPAGFFGITRNDCEILKFYLKDYGILFVLCFACSLPCVSYAFRRLMRKKWSFIVFLPLLLYCLYSLAQGLNNPFMYFRF